MKRRIKYLGFYIIAICLSVMVSCKSLQRNEPIPNFYCDFETGNLLFVLDTNTLSGYCHVAITECIDTTLYVYDIGPSMQLEKHQFEEWVTEWYLKFDTAYAFPGYVHYFALKEPLDIAGLQTRLSEYTSPGAPKVDDITLLRHCFFTNDGKHVFGINDTSLNQIANSAKLHQFRIQ